MKTIEITDIDYKQVVVVYKLLQEAKFEIKGDAVGTAAIAMNWVAELSRRIKDAKETSEPVIEEISVKKRSK